MADAKAKPAVKPIKIVVPFAPGGGNDVFARQMAKGLGEVRSQTWAAIVKTSGATAE
jgi:tripartite-type tricarboxylate transporter receptor subunit TctC